MDFTRLARLHSFDTMQIQEQLIEKCLLYKVKFCHQLLQEQIINMNLLKADINAHIKRRKRV